MSSSFQVKIVVSQSKSSRESSESNLLAYLQQKRRRLTNGQKEGVPLEAKWLEARLKRECGTAPYKSPKKTVRPKGGNKRPVVVSHSGITFPLRVGPTKGDSAAPSNFRRRVC